MTRKTPALEISKAIEGFIQYKTAEALSAATLVGYSHDLQHWLEYQGDMDVGAVTPQRIRQYLAYMLTEYVPHRLTGHNEVKLSPRTVRNVWVTLASFFHWANDEFHIPNPMEKVPAPKFQYKPVDPFTREEVEALLEACDYTEEVSRANQRKFIPRRPTAARDKAIILVLVDTGLRASELCALRIGDYDSKTGKLDIRHGVEGGAKGKKGRTVYLGTAARYAVWRYLAKREDGTDLDAPLFQSTHLSFLNRETLRNLITRLGEKASVKKAFPHRFRHTFAITYLRSGGDVISLQRLLGHSSIDMVHRYARLAEVDLELAHRKASPADNWNLKSAVE